LKIVALLAIIVAGSMLGAAFIGGQYISNDGQVDDDPFPTDDPEGSGEAPLCHHGTSIEVDKTATGFWEMSTEYDWTVNKTMEPAIAELGMGDSVGIDVTIDADREQTSTSDEKWGVRGEVTVSNVGDWPTNGFLIYDVVEKRAGNQWVEVADEWILCAWVDDLDAGETKSYSYEIHFDGPVDSSSQYRNTAKVRIKNHAGHIGCWFGPNEKESFTIPESPNIVGSTDHSSTLVDSMVVPSGLSVSDDIDGPWYLSGPSLIEYTITVTNTGLVFGDCAEIVNTALLTENDTLEERQDDASVTICSLGQPPGELVAYKFNDINMNGVWDVNEPPVEGWGIIVKDQTGAQVGNGQTDSQGSFGLTLQPGNYTVEEEQRGGWVNTTIPSIEAQVSSGLTTEVFFGNYEQGGISVLKYYDANRNGQFDDSECPLQGWTITIDDGEGYVVSQVTNESGIASFLDLAPGQYTVYETIQDYWYNVTPASVTVNVTAGMTVEVEFGNDQLADLDVMKFHDMNGNGVYDTGEETLSGWTIELWQGDILVQGKSTNDLGSAFFGGILPGSYTVKEIMKEGWYATTAAEIDVTLDSGDYIYVLIGNAQFASIDVYKFYDTDMDGLWDDGEQPIDSWPMVLKDGEGDIIASALTDADGKAVFDYLVPGDYTVIEDDGDGWFATTPDTVDVILASGQNAVVEFGNAEYSYINVYKFNDLNTNGVWDEGEPPIENWIILLWNDGPQVSNTDSNGEVVFGPLMPGTYTIEESTDDGQWTNTTPSSVEVTVGPGETAQVDFGNYESSVITAYKFDDQNANGVMDLGEPLLEGWNMILYKWIDGGWQEVDQKLTDSLGKAAFFNLSPGDYKIFEVCQSGWYDTDGLERFVTLDTGESKQVYIGNVQWSGIEVFKFFDLNSNGVHDDGEPGMPDWVFSVEGMGGEISDSTNSEGYAFFDELGPGHYTVTETLQSGFYSTTGTVVEVDIGVNETVHLEFGNADYAMVDVYKFNDLDADGDWDMDEPYLNGWTMEVYNATGELVDSKETANIGVATFFLEAGDYTVKEVMEGGCKATTPMSFNISVDPGDLSIIEFGNVQTSSITVKKYYDLDADGKKDSNETWLDGWEFTLLDSSTSPIASGVTYHGIITFSDLLPGTYYLEETIQQGWYCTGPLIRTIDLGPGEQYAEFYGNLEYASIEVFKFYDYNVNGIYDDGDWPLEDVQIFVEGESSLYMTYTDENGTAVFGGLSPGTYVVSEAYPEGYVVPWFNTTEIPVTVELSAGETAQVEIGNSQYCGIFVMKRVDLNGDGVIQFDEPSAAGWTIELYQDGELLDSGETIADDYIVFENLIPGNYTLKEIMKPGWTNLSTSPIQKELKVPPNTYFYTSFQNVQLCDLTAQKYNDLNQNGVRDEGEPGLEGWEFDLLDETGAVMGTGVTDANGQVSFTGLMPGDYTLQEVMQPGWFNTTPMVQTVTLAPGDDIDVEFGNAMYLSIEVFKFYDLNLNGYFDGDDYPMAGWNISIEGNNESAWMLTDDNGWANFTGLKPGTYSISEEQRDGWIVTSYPYPATVELQPCTGVQYWLGNAEKTSITIHKFYDSNMNGIMDEGEEPLQWWFFLEGPIDLCYVQTNESGEFQFEAPPGLLIWIGEEGQEGWFPTTPDYANVIGGPGEEVDVYFGNCEYGDICAFKFNDTNENGIWDEGEEPLSGWTMYLMDEDNNTLATGTTNGDGRVCFTDLVPGVYIVEEELPPDWENITPKVRMVDLRPGEVRMLYFGNALPDYRIDIVKTGPEEMCWDNEIVWNITVCNIGNEPLRYVKMSDPLTGFSTVIEYLDIGECQSFQTSIFVPYGWCHSNWITNTVHVWAWGDANHTVTDETSHTVFVAKPDIDLVKTGPEVAIRGQMVEYEVTVINDGNVPLMDVHVTDLMVGLDETIMWLDVDESITYCVPFVIPEDRNCSVITNWAQTEAWYYGTFEPRECITEDSDCHEIVIAEAELTVIKTGPENATAGEYVEFNIQVINTGDVWLEDVYVCDRDLEIGPIMIGNLAPGQSVNVSVGITIPANFTGEFTNTAYAWGDYQDMRIHGSDSWIIVVIGDAAD
jgi:uncharacterized surface anchored protein